MRKPRLLDVDGEAFLRLCAASTADALRQRRFRVTRHWAGSVSDAYLLRFEDGGRAVCKVARPGQSLSDEVAVLTGAWAAAAEGVVPALLQVLGGGEAYLAEHVPGVSPPVYLRKRAGGRQLAGQIVAALIRYQVTVGQAFGDFHPENVCVRPSGVTLLDPGRPDQHGRDDAEPAMVTDFGLWLHATASNVITYVVRSPLGALRMMNLTVDMVGLACGPDRLAAEAVLGVSSRHMDDLRRSRWPRDRITAVVAARPCLWWLKYRIRRRIQASSRSR